MTAEEAGVMAHIQVCSETLTEKQLAEKMPAQFHSDVNPPTKACWEIFTGHLITANCHLLLLIGRFRKIREDRSSVPLV